jgi:hypothetical protein
LCALKATVLAAVEVAESAIEDLKIAVNHVRRGAPDYVPGQEVTYPETLSAVSVVFTRYKSKEIDNDRVMSSDWKGLVFFVEGLPDFQTSDLIRVAVTVGDIPAGDYRIVDDDKVTVGDRVALHQLQLRRT